MKSIFKVLISLSIISVLACNNVSDEFPDTDYQQECINHFLDEYDMKEYNGETIPCSTSYLVLFENDNSTFAILHNDCADLAPQMIEDCEGNELCVYVTEDGCFEMVQDSERIGIIGYDE